MRNLIYFYILYFVLSWKQKRGHVVVIYKLQKLKTVAEIYHFKEKVHFMQYQFSQYQTYSAIMFIAIDEMENMTHRI